LGNSADIRLIENNRLRATWQIDLVLNIPASADLDNRNRSEKMNSCKITSYLILRKNSRRLEIKTRVDNSSRDHRLRVLFPTELHTDYTYAGGAFDILKRRIQLNEVGDNAENDYPFKPMKDFVEVTDGVSGFAFLGKGLNEYEVMDDQHRTMAITLMRTHRAYMLANKGLLTPDEYKSLTRGQHCLKTLEFEYAIYIHEGDWKKGVVKLHSQDFKVPMRIIQGVPKPGELPCLASFLKLSPVEHVHFSALYKLDNEKKYVLRLWNSSDEDVDVSIESLMALESILKISMDETRIYESLVCKQGKWFLTMRRAEICTLLMTVTRKR
jgi:mannosylglycerate hydrolase